jgi:plastocyanin
MKNSGIFKQFVILLSMVATFLLLSQVAGTSSIANAATVKKVSIVSIKDLSFTVNKGDKFSLPKKVQALMSNKTKAKVTVVWSPSSVDTGKLGKTKYLGTVKGYNKKVTLTLTIKAVIQNTAVIIEISQYAFNPDTLTVTKGTKVKWINKDSVSHTVTGTGFDSGSLSNGESFEYLFNTAGTFDYVCSIHASMKGKIIVK